MTSRDFCYWLQGLFELGKPAALTTEQTELVRRHLSMVFKHEIDPSAGGSALQEALTKIHEGQTAGSGAASLAHLGPGHDVRIRC